MVEGIGSDASYYQYKLIKKISLSKNLNTFYLIIPFITAILVMTLVSWSSIFYFLLAAPIVLWIQYVISRSTLLVAGPHYHKRWAFSLKLPWIGYMPNQYISYPIFRRVNTYTMWISLCIFVILIFWSPLSFIIGLLFWHLWFMLPHIYTIIGLSGQRKDGMIKFNPQDISYYKQ